MVVAVDDRRRPVAAAHRREPCTVTTAVASAVTSSTMPLSGSLMNHTADPSRPAIAIGRACGVPSAVKVSSMQVSKASSTS